MKTNTTYEAAVIRSNTRLFKNKGVVLYQRRLGHWERRVARSTYVEYFEPCKRLPRAIRALNDVHSRGSLDVEFDTATRTAKLRVGTEA